MEVYADRIGIDQEEQERLRFSADDIVKLPAHRAINLWVADGAPRSGFIAQTLPMEPLHDEGLATHHRDAQHARGGHHPNRLGDPLRQERSHTTHHVEDAIARAAPSQATPDAPRPEGRHRTPTQPGTTGTGELQLAFGDLPEELDD